MKKLFLLTLLIGSLCGCKCKKPVMDNDDKNNFTTSANCRTNAKCTQALLKDVALVIEQDVTGKPFYTTATETGTTVYRYIMDENQDQQYVDGGYREEIVFELPSDFKNETISGKQILQTKALFGVFCYCKEKAGYYTIQEGTITKTADAIVMEIPAIIEGQKVRTIKFVL
jgi:hypothetical protein